MRDNNGAGGIALLNASQLLTMDGPGTGEESLGLIEGGGVLMSSGEIVEVGASADVERALPAGCEIVDAEGCVVTPGLIDPHTHVVFAGSRELEFEMRLKGASYSEIAKGGGGIRSSVRALRSASSEDLKADALARLAALMSYGVTTAEVKSGYGLSTRDEIRTLEIVKDLAAESPVEVVPTFLGAHEVPDEYQSDREAYVDLVIDEMIPEVARRGLAAFCDVFCEEGVFDVEQSRRILAAGARAGLVPKVHADELTPLGGAELAAEVGAASADHLTKASDRGIAAMKEAGVVPVLLPGTSFFLRSEYAPARKMLDAGLPVALASDMNPGSCTTDSLPLVMTIACLNMGMVPFEAVRAVTVNAAKAIGMDGRAGALRRGLQADIAVFNAERYQYIIYHFGSSDVRAVYKNGVKAYGRP
jgi:imidazolonepropionase